MTKNLFSIAIIAMVAASCGSSGNNRVEQAAPAPTTFTPATTTLPDSGNQGAVATAPANGAATVAINPAHGAPGHRCELPVGAPLDGSAGNAAAAPPMIQMQQPSMPAPQTTARLNPAHGAPGHDCSIPVGQPLNN